MLAWTVGPAIAEFLCIRLAGKTTLISVLTGVVRPTSGSAWVGGLSVAEHMPEIRKGLGKLPLGDGGSSSGTAEGASC